MRIALILPGGVDRSGTERVIPVFLWLIERLARRHQITVIALSQYPRPCSYELLGAKIYNLGEPPPLPFGWIPYHLKQLWEIEAAEGGFDVMHAFWGGKTAWLAGCYGKLRGIPNSASFCGGELVALPEVGYGAQRSWRGRLIVTQVLQWAAHITTQSRPMQDLIATRGRHAEHLPFGVDESCFSKPKGRGRSHEGEHSTPRRLLQVASLNPVKDQNTLLQAMAKVVRYHPKVHLDLIGEDTLGGKIQAGAQRWKLQEKVTFHGFLPQEKIRRFYQQADLFLLTSRHEAGPVAVLEAAACGVPTVGSRVGHIADWEGREALAVPVADPEALAGAILELLNDEPRRMAMGRAAQQWATHYSADFTASRFEEIFATLISNRPPLRVRGGRGEVKGSSA